MKLKKLIEQRNAKLTRMNELMNQAENEARALTEDEAKEFDTLESEARALAETIHRNEQLEGAGLNDRNVKKNAPAADDSDIDADEARAFADYLRGVSLNGHEQRRERGPRRQHDVWQQRRYRARDHRKQDHHPGEEYQPHLPHGEPLQRARHADHPLRGYQRHGYHGRLPG